MNDDLQEGRSTSIEALSGFKELSPGLTLSNVWLLPGSTVGLAGSNALGADSVTLLLTVGMVFLMN